MREQFLRALHADFNRLRVVAVIFRVGDATTCASKNDVSYRSVRAASFRVGVNVQQAGCGDGRFTNHILDAALVQKNRIANLIAINNGGDLTDFDAALFLIGGLADGNDEQWCFVRRDVRAAAQLILKIRVALFVALRCLASVGINIHIRRPERGVGETEHRDVLWFLHVRAKFIFGFLDEFPVLRDGEQLRGRNVAFATGENISRAK